MGSILSSLFKRSDSALEEPSSKVEQRGLLSKIFGDRKTYVRGSPEAYNNLAGEYLDYIGLGTDATFSAKAFDAHIQTRTQDVSGLKGAKLTSGALIHEKLASSSEKEAAKVVQDAVRAALAKSPAFTLAQEAYEKEIREFTEIRVKNVPKKYTAGALERVFREISDTAIKAIKEQQQLEVSTLKAQFVNADFNKVLISSLGIDPADLETTQDSMLKDLQATHDKQKSDFDSSVQETVKTVLEASARQHRNFLFIAELHKNDKAMREMIESLAGKNRLKMGITDPTSLDVGENGIDISSVKVEQLEYIRGFGGGKITPQAAKDGEPALFKLELGKRIFNSGYYRRDDQIKDMVTIAQAVRASGADSIIMNVDFSNDSIGRLRARQVYEACLKSGFTPDKITINLKKEGQLIAKYTEKGSDKKDERERKEDIVKSFEKDLFGKQSAKFAKLKEITAEIPGELAKITPFEQAKRITEDYKELTKKAAATAAAVTPSTTPPSPPPTASMS